MGFLALLFINLELELFKAGFSIQYAVAVHKTS